MSLSAPDKSRGRAPTISCDACKLASEVTSHAHATGWYTVFYPNGQRNDYCYGCGPLALPPPMSPITTTPFGPNGGSSVAVAA